MAGYKPDGDLNAESIRAFTLPLRRQVLKDQKLSPIPSETESASKRALNSSSKHANSNRMQGWRGDIYSKVSP